MVMSACSWVMKLILLWLLFTPCLLAGFKYPPQANDARVDVYRKVGDVELRMWIFGETDPAKRKPAILFFYGGSWRSGSPAQFERQARHFAGRGMIAITADYRVKSRHGTPATACIEDANAAVALIHRNAERLGIDPGRIAAAGGSAGGHIAACTGTVPGFGAEQRPAALILFNPASTLAPTEHWTPRGFGTDVGIGELGAEARAISPTHHVGDHTPPTLILHGEADQAVPIESARSFAAAMNKAGRPCKLVAYPGPNHGFFNHGEAYASTLSEADRFLVELGWITAP